MNNSGLGMMPLAAVLALGEAGLMSCSCPSFMHYTMCVHVMSDAKKKGIMGSVLQSPVKYAQTRH